MANTLDLSTICDQRRKRSLFNIPLSRYTPLSPYPQYTQQQLNMRRKVEILKYSSNTSNSKTNNLTKKQLFSLITAANYTGNTLICPDDINLPSLTSSCDVPGEITVLQNDNTVPLYNFAYNTNSYAEDNYTPFLNWSVISPDNSVLFANNDRTITSFYIIKTNNQDITNFSVNTPFAIYINGRNINPLEPLTFTIQIVSISTIIYYSGSKVELDTPPTRYYTTMATPISITLKPPAQNGSSNFSYSAFVYSGMLKLSNINLQTQPGYVYDIKLNFVYSISSNSPSIINNTNVYIYTNLTPEFYSSIRNNISPVNNVPAAYNCVINSGISTDTYESATFTGKTNEQTEVQYTLEYIY